MRHKVTTKSQLANNPPHIELLKILIQSIQKLKFEDGEITTVPLSRLHKYNTTNTFIERHE